MAVNLTRKKSDTMTKLISLIPKAMKVTADIKELQNFATDNLFLTGGANAIIDADCVGENSHLDAASFNAAMTALASLNLSAGNATTLRKASATPIAGGDN